LVVCAEAVSEAGKAGDQLSRDFFREEYTLNHLTGEYVCDCVS